MSTTLSPQIIETWIYGVLSGDSTVNTAVGGRIFSYNAPQGSLYPAVVFAPLSGVDITPPGGLRFLTTMRYAVKAIAQTSSAIGLGALAARIDFLLHNAQYVPASGGLIASCLRTNIFPISGTENGIQYRQTVQIYSLQIREA